MDLITQRLKLKDVFSDLQAIFPKRMERIAQDSEIDIGEMEYIRKGLAPEPLVVERDVNEKERSITSYITTARKDRDKEVVLPEGAILDDYRKHPIVLFGHKYDELGVGRNGWIKADKKGLAAKTIYTTKNQNPFGDQVYQYRLGGFPLAESIGFIPLKQSKPGDEDWSDVLESWRGKYKDVVAGVSKAPSKEDDPECIYTKWILLEYSDVTVPSNPAALQIAISKGLIAARPIPNQATTTSVTGPLKDAGGEGSTEIVHKPEVTENYIRIPVRECEITATIDISKEKGIKGLYCGKEKKVATYLFAKDKGWTMAKAEKWVADHDSKKDVDDQATLGDVTTDTYDISLDDLAAALKSDKSPDSTQGKWIGQIDWTKAAKPDEPATTRWNKALPVIFDAASREEEGPTVSFQYKLLSDFLDCEVKNIYRNSYHIPSPMLGTYLAAFKSVLGDLDLATTRNFHGKSEVPPIYEVIQLNSEKSDDFLIEGINFYKSNAAERGLVVEFYPAWSGMIVQLFSNVANKEWNKEILATVHEWARDNNFLKGENFALSGEFLDTTDETWEDLITEADVKNPIEWSVDYINKKGSDTASRGMLLVGVPGTGKTLSGRIIMNSSDATFIWVSAKDFNHIRTSYALSLGFELARDLSPSVLFIEDIDYWLGGSAVDLMKTELDGIRRNKGVLTLLTSNHPETLPDALLDRPGRFHHVLEFPLPSKALRREMLEKWAGTLPDGVVEAIVEGTQGFSGAHIRELVDFAGMMVEESDISMGDALIESSVRLIDQRELIEEIRERNKELFSVSELVAWKSVIPFKDTGKAPEDAAWDAGKEVREAEIADLKIMCTWYDSENADAKGSYKLPHHKASSGHSCVWRGVAAAMGALLGARGGVNVPAGDRKSIFNHLSKHYKHWDKTPPEFKEYSEEEVEQIEVLITSAFTKDMAEGGSYPDWADTLVAIYDAGGGDEPEDYMVELSKRSPEDMAAYFGEKLLEKHGEIIDLREQIKEGRVLSEKNRKLVKAFAEAADAIADSAEDVAEMAMELYNATEPGPKQAAFDLEDIQVGEIDLQGADQEISIEDIASPDSKGEDIEIDDLNQEAVVDIITSALSEQLREIEKEPLDPAQVVNDMIDQARGKVT